MNTLVSYLLLCALLISTVKANQEQNQDVGLSVQDIDSGDAVREVSGGKMLDEQQQQQQKQDDLVDSGRGLASSGGEDPHIAFKKRAKPLKNIFMGIYKNYKSTYLGNRTSIEYKQGLRDRLSSAPIQNDAIQDQAQEEKADEVPEMATTETAVATTDTTPYQEDETPTLDTLIETVDSQKSRKRRRKYRNRAGQKARLPPRQELFDGTEPPMDIAEQNFNVGPGMNVSLDMGNDIINVKLDGENIKEIITGRWLNDDKSDEARGKKYEMVTKVLPLFILPFLIQSAIVPFLVTKLKLLLVKSILVGKLAIFLLVISAIKNSNKMMQTYEVAPSYWAGEPSRRTELAAAASSAASSAAYNGYRVDGKPLTWIN